MSEAVLVESVEEPLETPAEAYCRVLGPFVLAACGLAAYANSFDAPFVFDGWNYLYLNESIRELWPPHAWLKFAATRPLGYFTFALNHEFGRRVLGDGYHPAPWHAVNLAIHWVAACALFGIARRTLQSPQLVGRFGASSARLALAIAALWIVHPLCTQSVTYLYQRLESLMGMFYLLTLYAFVRYADSRHWIWAAAALLFCISATTTKEVAVTAPLMILWYDRAMLAPSWSETAARRGLMHAALWATLIVPAALMLPTFADGTYRNAGILDVGRVTPWQYARTQPEVVQHYLRLSVVPYPLNIDYAWPIADDWRRIVPASIVIGGLLALTAAAVWKRPPLGFVGGWWFVILAPTSSIAPIVDLAFEHRTYLPLIAPIVLVVVGAYCFVDRLVRRCGGGPATTGAVRAVLLIVATATMTTMTLFRNHDYRSSVGLWRDVVRLAPHNHRGHYNYGVYLQLQGDRASMDEAVRAYNRSLELFPNYADPHLNLAGISAWAEQWPQAQYHYGKVVELDPRNVAAWVGLADALDRTGLRAEARQAIARALELDPHNAEARKLQTTLTATPTATAGRRS